MIRNMIQLAALVLTTSVVVWAQSGPPLTVVVVIDQFPQYLVERHEDLFSEHGFKRLAREGMLFTECRYRHAVLETGPGHTTIATGCNPHKHGIVGNAWLKRDGKEVYCMECNNAHPVRDEGVVDTLEASCPDNILAEGLSDIWRAGFGKSAKIWSMSLKDRAAIAMGGKSPDGALWLNRANAKFETSSYYGDVLPEWCMDYNKSAGRFFDATWERTAKPEAYFRSDTDDAWYEDGTKSGLPNTMPKSVKGGEDSPGKGYARAMMATPFGNELLFGLAKECIESENMGKDATPDLLWVSFSSNDMCGHLFGPYSQEILDMTVRTDKVIADLLALLDKEVGKGKYVLGLTADHGVCPACESPLVPSGMGGRLDIDKMKEELQDYFAQKFLAGVLPTNGLVSALDIPTVYLNQENIDKTGLETRDVAATAAEWLAAQQGISEAVVTITRDDVARIDNANLRAHIEQNFSVERFSQVYVHPQPYWQSDGICANHGTIHDYDTHVPLYLYGGSFKGGITTSPAAPTDLVCQIAQTYGLRWPSDRDSYFDPVKLK